MRQSKEEVDVEKEEKAEKKNKAVAKVKEAKKHHLVGVQHVAAKENKIEKQVKHGWHNAACPDQVNQDLYQEHQWLQAERELELRPISPANKDNMELDEAGDLGVETDNPADFPPKSTVGTSESEPEFFGAAGIYELDGDDDDNFIPKKAEGKDDEKESEEEDMEAAFKLWLKTNSTKKKDIIRKTKEKEKDVIGKTKKKKEKERVSIILLYQN